MCARRVRPKKAEPVCNLPSMARRYNQNEQNNMQQQFTAPCHDLYMLLIKLNRSINAIIRHLRNTRIVVQTWLVNNQSIDIYRKKKSIFNRFCIGTNNLTYCNTMLNYI